MNIEQLSLGAQEILPPRLHYTVVAMNITRVVEVDFWATSYVKQNVKKKLRDEIKLFRLRYARDYWQKTFET